MKIFSSVLAFVMIFACLSVAYADVALPPRPRNVQSDFVTLDVDDRGKLNIMFDFPYECSYEYQLIGTYNDRYKNYRQEVVAGKGESKLGETVEEVVDLDLYLGKNCYLLKIQMRNIKEQTRFGKKIRSDNREVVKTIVIERNYWGKVYGLRVFDGEQS